MESNVIISPLVDEKPEHFADRLGLQYTKIVTAEHKKERGQFFTPDTIALLMGSFSTFEGDSVRILDPGCGTGVLSCSLIEQLISVNKELKDVVLEVYETDTDLLPYLNNSLEYLKAWLCKKSISLLYIIHIEDFVLENAECLNAKGLFTKTLIPFDIIISNPPYFKLSIDDRRSIAAKCIINGHPNIYSIFMAICASLLCDNGELILITPRSYASGSYFKTFREYFFNIIELEKVHLFISRKDTFNRDNVLQETVIIKGRRRSNGPNNLALVTVASSHGLKDIGNPEIKNFELKDLMDVKSNEKILFLPTNDYEESVLTIFRNWNGSLNKYNMQISTGPVVAFRAWEYIKDTYENEVPPAVPLFWLHNINQMSLEWPKVKPNKGQYILLEKRSASILIPNKNYIFLRRFSSKDDKNRLVAAPYFRSLGTSDFIGVENKVNYIYRPNSYLERNELLGLCALLNSSLFNSFFSIFNGNVNVSATELREMPLPPLEAIKELGNAIILSNDFSVENTNKLVTDQFELSAIYD